MRHHVDVRREFWGNVFPSCREGDINLVRPTQNVFIGWHRHQRQDDRLFLVNGVLRLRIFTNSPADGVEWILVETPDRAAIVVPRNTWHGYEALTDDTVVMQFNSPGKWDGTDEERLDLEAMPWP